MNNLKSKFHKCMISRLHAYSYVQGCVVSGFGNALARRLNSVGFTVVAGCLDKSSDGAQLLKSDSTGHLHILQLDITDDKNVQSCVDYIREQFPGQGAAWFKCDL